jgi:hypothetical protein
VSNYNRLRKAGKFYDKNKLFEHVNMQRVDSYISTVSRLRAERSDFGARHAKIIMSLPLRCSERLGSNTVSKTMHTYGSFSRLGCQQPRIKMRIAVPTIRHVPAWLGTHVCRVGSITRNKDPEPVSQGGLGKQQYY